MKTSESIRFASSPNDFVNTLNKRVNAHRDMDVVLAEDRELARENERLRREIRVLKEERDILKKATQFFASLKP